MNKWTAIPLLQYSVEFLQMHSCGQRRNGKYVADVKYGVWMAARCCIEAAGDGDGVQENLRRRLDMSGRFNVAPMATRPLPSQYNDTDSMHRSHPLWACTELWVKFRGQTCVSSVLECLSVQYSTTVHSGLGISLPSVSQLFHSANNSASIPWKLVEQQLFRWNGQFHNLSTRIRTTTQNLEISQRWWNMLHTTHSLTLVLLFGTFLWNL